MKLKVLPLLLALAGTIAAPAWAAPLYQLRVGAPGVKAPPPPPELLTAALTGTSDFGQVTVGQVQGVLLTLTNTAAHTPLTVQNIFLSGTRVARTGTDSCPTGFPAMLPAASSCTILAVWSPTAAGTLAGASVTVQDDANVATQVLALSGQATLPAATSSFTGTTDFGSVAVGASKTVSLTVGNTSQYTPLRVSDVAVVGTGISWKPGSTGIACANTFPQTLPVGQSCTIDVTWTPTVEGSLTGAALSITDNAQSAAHQLTLSGTATQAPDPYFANVVALLPFDGGGDVKGNALTLVGAAGTSTVQKHSGTASAYFHPSGDAIKIDKPALFDFPGDFTIEGWVYPTSSTASHVFSIGGVDQLNWQSQSLWIANGQFVYTACSTPTGGNDIAPSSAVGAAVVNSWNHYAITRNGAVYRTFINGKLTATFNVNKKPYTPQYGFLLGNYPYKTWTSFPNTYGAQYIDDVRVTKGVARYTTDFTPSSKAFPTQ